jgi:hypothetical protein
MKLRTAIIVVLTLLLIVVMFCKKGRGCEFLAKRDTGKVISVNDNNHVWGSGEKNSLNFTIVKCSTMSLAKGMQYKDKYYFNVKNMSKTNKNNFNKGKLSLTASGATKCLNKVKK